MGGKGPGGPDTSSLAIGALHYDSTITTNRMTGNWWFPLDVFIVPQTNGDLHY